MLGLGGAAGISVNRAQQLPHGREETLPGSSERDWSELSHESDVGGTSVRAG